MSRSKKRPNQDLQLSLFDLPMKKTRKRISRQCRDYLVTYHALKESVFVRKYGVRGLCQANRQISELSVLNSAERRLNKAHWRQDCSDGETRKLTLNNIIHAQEVQASPGNSLQQILAVARLKVFLIDQILNSRFDI